MFQIIKKGLTTQPLYSIIKKKGGNKMDTMILLEMAMGFTLWAIVEVAERLFLDDDDS